MDGRRSDSTPTPVQNVAIAIAREVVKMQSRPPEASLHPIRRRSMVHERHHIGPLVAVTPNGKERRLGLRISIDAFAKLSCECGICRGEHRSQRAECLRVAKNHVGIACERDIGANAWRLRSLDLCQARYAASESPCVAREHATLDEMDAFCTPCELAQKGKPAVARVVVDDDHTMDASELGLS